MQIQKNKILRIVLILNLVLFSLLLGYFGKIYIERRENADDWLRKIYPPEEGTTYDPTFEYVMTLRLHDELKDIKKSYTDSLINASILRVSNRFHLKNILRLIKCDSISYAVIGYSSDFTRHYGISYLLTQDHIYSLNHEQLEFYDDSTKTFLSFPK